MSASLSTFHTAIYFPSLLQFRFDSRIAARPANTLQLASCASVHPKPLTDEVQSIRFNYNFLRNNSNLAKSLISQGFVQLQAGSLKSSCLESAVRVCVCVSVCLYLI